MDITSALLGGRVVQPDPAWRAGGTTLQGHSTQQFMTAEPIKVDDPAWRAGGTTLQGHSTQQFMTAEPIKVDPTRKVTLVLRLVARYDRIIIRVCEHKNLSNLRRLI